jgi:TPP-dependent 2-oxoacid decarboxylase
VEEIAMSTTWTVGSYLTRRLEQAGVGHIFGVPGDYCLQLFDSLEAGNLEVVGTCNELNAGYAADGYARLNGVGAVAVTYDVGGFSLLNAVAGAYAERVPVIVVSGAPRSTEAKQMHVLHHTTGDLAVQYNVYRNVTAVAVRLAEATKAPAQIDEAVGAALLHRRPTYIEVPLDLVNMRCRAPGEYVPPAPVGSDPGALREAVEEAAAMLECAATATACPPACPAVIMAGVEAHRRLPDDCPGDLNDRAPAAEPGRLRDQQRGVHCRALHPRRPLQRHQRVELQRSRRGLRRAARPVRPH